MTHDRDHDPSAPTAAPSGHHMDTDPDAEGFTLSQDEQSDVEQKLPPSPTVLHETVRTQGEKELSRRASALAWSALAAGLSMGFSMLFTGMLRAYLPDTAWRHLLDSMGYPVGFLIVILARQQLFTENTLTAVLPLMTHPSWHQFRCLLRLWSVVLLGNLVGVTLFAYGLGHLPLLDSPVQRSLREMGETVMRHPPAQMFTRGVVAGWLIAVMVWLVPAAGQSKAAIIFLMTYLIGLGGFTHIIVDSERVLYLAFLGQIGAGDYVVRFALPTLAGNIVGGSLIFALISHAQVRSDEN